MKTKRPNGFILLLVVSLIPLIGVVSAVLMVNSRHLLIHTRLEALDLQARAALESGAAWAYEHVSDIDGNAPIVLSVDERTDCRVELLSRDAAQAVVRITGTAQDNRFQSDEQRDIIIPLRQ